MPTTSKKRKKLPVGVETQILTESRRRCCLCFHFDDDLDVKRGQIAHIDHQRNNNTESNLAFLCFDHHDEYDELKSQSKGITQSELRHSKKALYEKLRQQRERVRLTVTVEADFDELEPDERQAILGKVLDLTSVKGEVRIINIERGSVRFTLDLDADDAAQLCKAFNKGELAAVGVRDVRSPKDKADTVSFNKSFQHYSHGVSKEQAREVVSHSDSVLLFNGRKLVGTDDAKFGLYLKRITDNYSVLVVTFLTTEVSAALPINHSYIDSPKGANPLEILKKVLDRFGILVEVADERAILRIGERIRLPLNVTTNASFIKYCESSAEKTGEAYELVMILERGAIVAPVAEIQLMFALSKDRYYRSLKDLGKTFQERALGRHTTWYTT